jgi:hypothetical protein
MKTFLLLFSLLTISGCKGGISLNNKQGANVPPDTVVTAQKISQAGLLGPWVRATDNAVIRFGSLADFWANFCNLHATIQNVTSGVSCPPGSLTCGSLSMYVDSSYGAVTCPATGTANCNYQRATYNLTLNCSGGLGSNTFHAAN